ncbi:molybdenum cofactor guanylyltransferase [Pseudobowmanella zhangzhouensis]|uniref:molybdenum cofactor guanylyltransferase n=1 Tax=Pseudobowmanella zhangzhouensis TaxID=1537679 RepID=UPI00361F6A0B
MQTHTAFTALILVSGLSSRMGQDKALLNIQGQTLLSHMQQLAFAVSAKQVLVSRNQGFIHDLAQPMLHQQGPLAGILASLSHCTSDRLLVLAVDTPLLTADSLQLLLNAAANQATYFTDSPLPCVLPVSASLANQIEQQLHAGKRSVKQLLDQLGALSVASSASELLNTNTPEQWQQCLNVLAHRRDYAQA